MLEGFEGKKMLRILVFYYIDAKHVVICARLVATITYASTGGLPLLQLVHTSAEHCRTRRRRSAIQGRSSVRAFPNLQKARPPPPVLPLSATFDTKLVSARSPVTSGLPFQAMCPLTRPNIRVHPSFELWSFQTTLNAFKTTYAPLCKVSELC